MGNRTCIRKDAAQLSWRQRDRERGGESTDMGTLMDVQCRFTALPTSAQLNPHPAEVGTKLTAHAR